MLKKFFAYAENDNQNAVHKFLSSLHDINGLFPWVTLAEGEEEACWTVAVDSEDVDRLNMIADRNDVSLESVNC